MLKYLGMITILWHLVTLAKRRTANITYVKFRLISLLAQNRPPITQKTVQVFTNQTETFAED